MQKSKLLIVLMSALVVVSGFLAFGIADEKASADQPVVAEQDKHVISLTDAAELTRNFRNANPTEEAIGGFFSREAVDRILDQEGASGIRYYYGEDADGTPHIILVGVNMDGNDIVDGELAERADLCPPFCSDWNELNSDNAGEEHLAIEQ